LSIDDHRFLVELACSTTLVPAYKPALFDELVPLKESHEKRTVVFIVCGGFKITLDDVAEYRGVVNKDARCGSGWWEVRCNNGRRIKVGKQSDTVVTD